MVFVQKTFMLANMMNEGEEQYFYLFWVPSQENLIEFKTAIKGVLPLYATPPVTR
jgi:hypothetical protein